MELLDVWYTLKSNITSIFPIEIWDIFDIAILAVLIYKAFNFVKETRAGGLLKGIAVFGIVYLFVENFDMKVMSFLMKSVFDIGLFSLIVLFQPELRRTLEKIGYFRVGKIPVLSSSDSMDKDKLQWNAAIEAICDSCEDLSATTTGALIVVEMDSKLGEQIDTGTLINAKPSKELFGNIFYPKTPLHDGAVIMRDGIVLAAACFLPKPQKEESINKALGSRHRAAIGMSEISDALIIVVSEETGTISVAENGKLDRGFTRDSLKKLLRNKLIPDKEKDKNKSKDKDKKQLKLFSKVKNDISNGGNENEE